MAGHLCKRALIALLTIFIIITLSFLMVRFMPGDPLIHLVGEENYYYMKEFNPQELERLAEKYAMSGTLGQQYGNYLSSILHLDSMISSSTSDTASISFSRYSLTRSSIPAGISSSRMSLPSSS